MVDISILTMVYKPTYNWGAQPCICSPQNNGGLSHPLRRAMVLHRHTQNLLGTFCLRIMVGIFFALEEYNSCRI